MTNQESRATAGREGDSVRGLPLWTGFALIVLAGAASWGFGWLVTHHGSPFPPREIGHVGKCTAEELQRTAALTAFDAYLRWLAMYLFLAVAALGATVAGLVALVLCARQNAKAAPEHRGSVGGWMAAIGVVAVFGLVAQYIWPHNSNGLLSLLIDTLPDDERCRKVRSIIFFPKFVGEASGVFAALGFSALLVLPSMDRKKTQEVVAARLRWLQMLLYAGATLFVAGVLCTEANASWILSHWVLSPAEAKEVTPLLGKVVKSGALVSGVAYSAALAVFYLPARLLLGVPTGQLAETEGKTQAERQKWLADNDMGSTWRDAVVQLLALLAPVISGSLFDALMKLR